MLNNRNLAANINAVSAYVKIYPKDRLFSVLPLHHCYESTIGFLLPIANGASIAICEGLRYIVQNLTEAKPLSQNAFWSHKRMNLGSKTLSLSANLSPGC